MKSSGLFKKRLKLRLLKKPKSFNDTFFGKDMMVKIIISFFSFYFTDTPILQARIDRCHKRHIVKKIPTQITCLSPRAGKMRQILSSDGIPEGAR